MGETLLLAADIGGTKTVIGLFSPADPSGRPLMTARYRNRDCDGIESIIRDFQTHHAERPSIICLGIAGVVDGPEVRVTNLPWVISERALRKLGFETVIMINDMTATAASLPLLEPTDLHCLQQGSGPTGKVAAFLAPGTGLGEGYVIAADGFFYPCGSEGGHCDFAAIDAEQRDYAAWLSLRSGSTASYEMACSGPAIAGLFDFYRERGLDAHPDTVRNAEQAVDRTPIIVDAACSGSCPASRHAVDQFLRILGREGAHLVLKLYARQGLYLGGGILPRLIGAQSFTPFLQAFNQPGAMADLLSAVPINVMLKPDHALLGAFWYAASRLNPSLVRSAVDGC